MMGEPRSGARYIGTARPDVALKIVQMVTSTSLSIKDLHEAISKDLGLVMRTLRLANSAAYGLPRKVENMERAVVLLGARAIGNIALAASMESTFNAFPAEVTSLDGKRLQIHALAVARAAEMICRYANVGLAAGEAFIAGLLHDIGMLASAWADPQGFETWMLRRKTDGVLAPEIEREYVGLDHAEEGMKIGIEWGLPPSICLAIGYHKRPLDTLEHSLLVSAVALAHYITGDIAGWEIDGSGANPAAVRKLLNRVGFAAEDWESLIGTIRPRLATPPEEAARVN
ncbi:MAG: HDOD domain-containing protein [Myxococcales bacterium]|nr:MAG: HDOD domain-containing protein [Myxococcales bacterium]